MYTNLWRIVCFALRKNQRKSSKFLWYNKTSGKIWVRELIYWKRKIDSAICIQRQLQSKASVISCEYQEHASAEIVAASKYRWAELAYIRRLQAKLSTPFSQHNFENHLYARSKKPQMPNFSKTFLMMKFQISFMFNAVWQKESNLSEFI